MPAPLYADLTQQEKDILDNGVTLLRAAMGEHARMWNHVQAISEDSNMLAIATGLNAGEVIPNASGLAGAADLTQQEVVDIYTFLNGVQNTNDDATFRARATKAAGIDNTIG